MFSVSAQQLDYVAGELLVHLEENVDPQELINAIPIFQNKITNLTLKTNKSFGGKIYNFTYNDEIIDDLAFLEYIKLHSLVFSAQFNHWISPRNIPDDPFFQLQWQFNNLGTPDGNLGADINATWAWYETTGGVTSNGDTIVVAMIDDGIGLNHSDLTNNLWKNHAEIPYNGIDDDENGYVDDYNGWNVISGTDYQSFGLHGTSVAGMIGANGNNEIGVTGINWDIKIMSIVASGGTEFDVFLGYEYVATQRSLYNETNGEAGTFVVATNISFGFEGEDPANFPIWCTVYDDLGGLGILNSAATTNENVNVDQVGDIPTSCGSQYLISVTATDNYDIRNFAGYGVESIDLAAPGENIYTLEQGNTYGYRSGTSFAAPLVAGLVGLIYSIPEGNLGNLAINQPQLTADLVKDFVFNGVELLPNLADEVGTGGRLNANNSISLALDYFSECLPPVITNIENSLNTVTVSFYDENDQQIDLIWRESQDMDWITLEDVSSPVSFNIDGNCVDYELYLKAICVIDEAQTVVLSDLSYGCCLAPEQLQVSLMTNNITFLNWEDILLVDFYVLQKREFDGLQWLDWTSIDTLLISEATVEGLEECREYEFRIEANCYSSISDYSESISYFSEGCTDCELYDYCESNGGVSAYEYISSVTIGDFSFDSGDDGGYEDFSSIFSFPILLNEPNVIQLEVTFPYISYFENWIVWIDFNNNEQFEDTEKVFFTETITNSDIITGTLNLPENISPGNSRMRVSMKYMQSSSSPVQSACEMFEFGEVEDYCIEFVASICLAPSNVVLLDTFSNLVLLEWDEVAGAENYEVVYSNVNSGNSATLFTSDNFITLTDLDFCSPYHLDVKSQCTSTISPSSELINFTSSCSTSNENIFDSEKWSILPNPFIDFIHINYNTLEEEDTTILIVGLDGKIVFQKDYILSPAENYLNIDNLSSFVPGVYFLSLNTGKATYTHKIIKF